MYEPHKILFCTIPIGYSSQVFVFVIQNDGDISNSDISLGSFFPPLYLLKCVCLIFFFVTFSGYGGCPVGTYDVKDSAATWFHSFLSILVLSLIFFLLCVLFHAVVVFIASTAALVPMLLLPAQV
jgi:hypothetical protein